jgi:hypothetical protein
VQSGGFRCVVIVLQVWWIQVLSRGFRCVVIALRERWIQVLSGGFRCRAVDSGLFSGRVLLSYAYEYGWTYTGGGLNRSPWKLTRRGCAAP